MPAPPARGTTPGPPNLVIRVFGEWSGTAHPGRTGTRRPSQGQSMIDAERAGVLASALAVDGYPVRGILGQTFGIFPDAVVLIYPSTSQLER